MMNSKINSNNTSLFDGLISKNPKSKDSNFSHILSNKEMEKPKNVENSKKEAARDEIKNNKPKEEISKKEDKIKSEDEPKEDDVKVDYKSVLDLLITLLQTSEDEIDQDGISMEDLKLTLDKLEGLDVISDLNLESLDLADINELFSNILKGDDFSELPASQDNKLLVALKEIVSELEGEDDLLEESKIDLITSEDKELINKGITNENLTDTGGLNFQDEKESNLLSMDNENEEDLIVEVKDNTKVNSKEKASDSSEDLETEISDGEGIRTDISTETRSKPNIILEETPNVRADVEINEEDVIKQIAEKIHFEIGEETTEIKLSLKPKILGDMTMNLEVTKGEIVAKVFVDNQKTKQIIETNLMALQEEIEDTGMEIKTFEVFVGSNNDYEQPADQGQFNFFNKNKKGNFQNRQNKLSDNISTNYEAGTIDDKQPSLLLDGQSMDLQA